MKMKKSLVVVGMVTSMLLAATPAFATVHVEKGATKIDQGMANNQEDFTINNDKIALSFAAGSNNYWNMTSGSILDIALMNSDGSFGVDLVNDVEFLNNLWTATGSYKGQNLLKADQVTYTLFKDGKPITDGNIKDGDKVVVTAKTRYWLADHKEPLEVEIQYTLEDHSNHVALNTIVKNPEGNDPYKNMYSGYSISTLAANMFGPYGYYPDVKVTGIGIGEAVNEPFGNFVATYGKASYNKGYTVSVQLDGANAYKGSSGYKDVYTLRDIKGGETYHYTGELLVSDKDATMPVIKRALEKNQSIKKGNMKGQISFNNKGLKNAYIIVEKEGSYIDTEGNKKTTLQPFAWDITDSNGKFDLTLPTGKYTVHAEAKGYTPSEKVELTVEEEKKVTKNFKVLQGAKTEITVVDEKGNSIDAKIEVAGAKTDVKTLGSNVFFTDPTTHKAEFNVPAGKLSFTASYGKDFESKPVTITDQIVEPGKTFKYQFVIPTLVETDKNWYGMDNHQHSDIGDGATPIDVLYKAQLAAKLDLNIVSDHDSVNNDAAMAALTKKGNRAFIPSLEVSPGWGHWGILNMDYSKQPISPDLTPTKIIKAGHDMGAVVVLNHPYSDYGFLKNRDGVKEGNAEGSDDFDLIELQSTMDLSKATNMDKLALDAAMSYWNKGMKKYLSAGSDQHDVTSTLYPGIIRLYAYTPNGLTKESYLEALLQGHAYVTMGPILTPQASTLFGSTQKVKAGEAYTLDTKVQAVNGLKRIDVYCEGKVIYSEECKGTEEAYEFKYSTKPEKNTWYSIVAVDGKDHYAVSNPIWVEVTK